MSIKKVVLVFTLLFCTNSYADFYKCTDKNGHINYSNVACDSKNNSQSIVDIPSAPKVPEKLPNDITLTEPPSQNNEAIKPPSNSNDKCDGRTYCSQMTSCEEATFFINNCPDTKMDGDMDGIPCESQWCN